MRTGYRRARDEDAEVIRAILDEAFESVWKPQISEEAAHRVVDEERSARYVAEVLPELWVATVDDAVAGMIHWRDDFIHALHVRGAFRRHGLGATLLALAEREIAQAGYESARLETDTFNTQSRTFYAHQGYEEVGYYPDTEWDSGLTTVLMVKPLA